MLNTLSNFIDEKESPFLLEFLFSTPAPESSILLRNDILLAFETWTDKQEKTQLLPGSWRFLRKVQEILACRKNGFLCIATEKRVAGFLPSARTMRNCCP